MNISLIGFGYWGPNYARIINQLDSLTLRWIIDTNSQSFTGFPRRYPQIQFDSHIESVLNDTATQAVIIATPATTHFQIAQACLKAGKHVLIEKPLTTSAMQARQLIKLAQRQRLTLMVGHTFVYNPAITYLKTYISQGKLGRLYYAYATRTNLGPVRTDVDAFWDLASHDISTLIYLFDLEPIKVTATAGFYIYPHRADVGFATLKFGRGILAHLHVSWLDPVKIRQLVLIGSKKMAIFDDTSGEEKLRIINKGFKFHRRTPDFAAFAKLSLVTGDTLIPRIESQEPLFNQLQAFVKSVATHRPPQTDGQHGLKVVKVLEKISRQLKP